MIEKPYYRRSEFWVAFALVTPGIITEIANLVLKAIQDHPLNPSDPLYPLTITAAAVAGSVYIFGRSAKKVADVFREIVGGKQSLDV